MFYQSKYEVVEAVLGLEMWVWNLDTPMDGIGGKKRKSRKEGRRRNLRLEL